MKTTTLALLATTALIALALPAQAAEVSAAETCVQYAYVADYHWYWLCVNPKSTSCPVYEKAQHGVTVTRTCIGGDVTLNAEPICTPETGDLDYRWSYCASTDLDCPLYRLAQNGTKTCLV